ncbi:LLM class flavin-dependent oxidoreductase [Zunongwangia sp.]|uniref:LLM class flavin-dependent oxidoreductase n=1 Tax=Zunongwangia sp. TaxID=1965325 RepID=UPI003AA8743B
MKDLKIGLLDQSVVRHNISPAQAIQETIQTIKLAEKLGYSRFWVSEHHNSKFIAGSAPEILLARLGAETNNIRIGSGGIMLPNYSAFKVAENFRLLETLYPGRIDLGIGRASGGDKASATLLNPFNNFNEEDYKEQLTQLNQFFKDEVETEQGRVYAVPQANTIPQQWILSSSGDSAKIAAKKGLNLAIAKFINGLVSPNVVNQYRESFVPTSTNPSPNVLLGIFVVCGETSEETNQMRKYVDYILLQFDLGNYQKFPDYETIQNHQFTSFEKERLHYNSKRIVSGTPNIIKEKISNLAKEFDVDEIMISTMSFGKELRFRNFELIAEALSIIPEIQSL